MCSESSALAVVQGRSSDEIGSEIGSEIVQGRSSGEGIGDDEKALALTAGVIPISGDTNLAILV